MINKQGLWFVTLFSLILVLGIYYVTVKDDSNLLALPTANTSGNEAEAVETNESSILVSLRVQDEEEMLKEMESLQKMTLIILFKH